ncbi:MAG: 4Fe-4S dicluster domain-containing protein [Methanomicrobiales archaeon]|nr:4Fe-4S dicluster domain-containing protein [Methanomicrobiales archaeon]
MFDSYRTTTLRYDRDACIFCRACLQVCPHAVFAAGPGHVQLAAAERCMECGACAVNCPANAISVDSGVGCANALIRGAVTGKETCGCCGDDEGNSCC